MSQTLIEAAIARDLEVTNHSRTKKLNAFADAFEVVEVLSDGSLYMKTKSHLIIESEGNQIFYSKEGEIVIKAPMLHLNPSTPIHDQRNASDFVDRIRIDATELLSQNSADISAINSHDDA